MKIKELHLRNIASIELADIDFEHDICDGITAQPASIFLIAGDTGAGKSVILDGIAMALYKKTPRTVGVADKNHNDFPNEQGQRISIYCIEQYTRLGISERDECYSELVFEGNDGQVYHAKLELGYLKARDKDANGNHPLKLRPPKWTYKVGNEDWQKVPNNGQMLQEAVGLSFEQFGRMAMLAQGQFASFLTGSKDERESILEQLTNTALFSTYGKAISNLYKSALAEKDTAQTAFNTEQQHTLSPERLAALNEQLQQLQGIREQLSTNHQQLRETLNLIGQIEGIIKAKQQAENRKGELENTMQTDDFKKQETLVTDWDATGDQRKLLTGREQALQKESQAKKGLEDARTSFARLSADLAHRELSVAQVQKQTEALENWLSERSGLDELFSKAEAIAIRLGQYQDYGKRLEAAQCALKDEAAKTPVLHAALAQWTDKADEARQEVKTCQEAIDALNNERNLLNPTEINKQIKDCTLKQSALKMLKEHIAQAAQRREAVEQAKNEIEAAATELKSDETACRTAQQLYEQKAKCEDEARSLLTTMQMSVEETLTLLRKRLRHDHADTCPLCGQSIDAHKLDDDFSHLLTPLQQREEQAKAELKEATLARDKAQSLFDNHRGAFDTKQRVLKLDIEKLSTLDKSICSEAAHLNLNPNLPLPSQIDSAMKQNDSTLLQLETCQKKAESLQKEITQKNEAKRPVEQKLQEAERQLQKAKTAAELNAKETERYTQEERVQTQNRQTLADELSALLGKTYPLWASETDKVVQQLKSEASEYCLNKRNAEKMRMDADKVQSLLSTLHEMRANLLTKHPEWDTPTPPCELQTANINALWTDLYSSVSHLEQALTEATESIAQASATLSSFYQTSGMSEESLSVLCQSEAKVSQARRQVSETKASHKSCLESIAVAERQTEDCLHKLKVAKVEEVPDRQSIDKELAEFDQRLEQNARDMGSICSQLKDNEANVGRLQQAKLALEKAAANYEKWDRLNRVFGGDRFRTLVQTYILRPLLNNANIYLERITDRYSLTCSEENERLSILVLDRYNKNQVRSATVLSGGERFMISLALSLALSSLNRQDMNVNILFIDEGFGTLDETSLNSVMSTLEKLQQIAGQTHRRVGIISHREELAERIAVKIQVKKKGEGRSFVEIKRE